ncbi:hypothetical protein AMTR_s00006p00263920 [Amborella trichopoda]|uniref:Uncharacterized protein n=1 Tax=Amborella trichopoda TaxID=13333 RepID=W1P7K5_AMBTC|nr:hypothetical protein AMTR_s00006p00263920 [Amborella trichopoda]
MDVSSLRQELRGYLVDKTFLVVLDDVWSDLVWAEVYTSFPDTGNANRFIITTRIGDVATPLHVSSVVYPLELLSKYDAWSLFSENAFWEEAQNACPLELVDEASLIVKKCGGLPLAIVAIGGMMSKKDRNPRVWAQVQCSLEWKLNNQSNFELVRGDVVRGVLLLTYKDLPPLLKHCCLYCCSYPEDYEISHLKLVRQWIAEGFIEKRPRMIDEEVAEE